MASVSYDHDNNGVADAVETYTYDASGRPTRMQYVHTGDGTADKFAPYPAQNKRTEFTYDGAGRITQWLDVQGGDRTSFAFTLDNANHPISATFDAQPAGQSPMTGSLAFTWVNNQLRQMVQTLGGGQSITNYGYDVSSRRIQESSPGLNGGADLVTSTYTWNSDSTLASVFKAVDGDGINARYTMRYFLGRQFDTVKTVNGQAAYTVTFTHDAQGRLTKASFDAGSNGSVDAVWTITWEDGACTPITLPIFDPLINSVTGYGHSLAGEFSLCAP